ncbi:MAG: Tetratricopeptide 2 repeat protein [Candidatus Solibacter sp.]|nr:Tetratricopeptide 2 repeat protein [Candidatus Solibacter sp.]
MVKRRAYGAFRAVAVSMLIGWAWCQAVATPDAAMERGRAGDYDAALKGLRATPNLPNAQALEAALLRAGDHEAAAAVLLARMPAPSADDLVTRFERVRQGQDDQALWATLEAAPDRALELADLYLQWGLTRDALELLGHKGPTGAPAPDDALFLYYRSYCRSLLDYQYYAGEDLRVAGTRSTKGVSPRLASATAVLESAVKRNPADAHAQYLTGVVYYNAGRMEQALDALEGALALRPGFPEAKGLLAKLPAGLPRKPRSVAPAGSLPSASKSAGPAAASAPKLAVVSAPKTPAEFAAAALRLAASGDIDGGMSYFTPGNFSNAKQEDSVREAYLELRLRRILAAAAAKQCGGLEQSIAAVNAPDARLSFTAASFADIMNGARIQYLIGTAYAACGDVAVARKQWENASKIDAGIATTDYAYPILALAQLEPEVGKARSRKALVFIARQINSAAAGHQGALLYSQGLLQALVGKQDDAASSFQMGAESGPTGIVEYLNLVALRSGR